MMDHVKKFLNLGHALNVQTRTRDYADATSDYQERHNPLPPLLLKYKQRALAVK